MSHDEVVDKVCDWVRHEKPDLEIEKEVGYKITLPNVILKQSFFRVDIVLSDKNTGKEIAGIECKSISDSGKFRELMAGVGQAYVFTKYYGRAYLALEVREDMLPGRRDYDFWKREAILENMHQDFGVGILFVTPNGVSCVREAKYSETPADTLFTRVRKK